MAIASYNVTIYSHNDSLPIYLVVMLLYIATARHKHEVMLTKEQLQQKEQLLQQLSVKEEDTMATINSKTSQLLAIKTLLEETQAALEQEREKNKQVMVEKER